MKSALIIPALNEGPRIYAVLQQIISHPHVAELKPLVVVIDDGSKDDTYIQAKKNGVTVLRHPINRGQGAALITGTEYAINQGAEVIMHFDADGQHNPDDIRRFIDHLQKNSLDIVLGSRFKEALGEAVNNYSHSSNIIRFIGTLYRALFKIKTIPFMRRLFLTGSYAVNTFISGVMLTDGHNGLRAFRKEVFCKMQLFQDRYAHATEYITEIKRLNLSYDELQVHISYDTNKKSQNFFDGITILKDLWLGKTIK